MTFWILALLMLLGAVLSILLPLSRAKVLDGTEVDALDVYRQQLAELEASKTTSQNAETLEVERAEIARRILKESRRLGGGAQNQNTKRASRIFASLAALVVIPVLSLTVYSLIGSPGTPDAPLSTQQVGKLEDKSIEEMVRMTERHLAKNPNDARGWTVLANVYGKLNRPSDRARAYEQIIRISGPNPDRLAELGEALTVSEGNIVSARARKLFETAWNQDKSNLKSSVYLALALEQEGRFEPALKRWKKLALSRRDDPQWQAMTAERISTLAQRFNQSKLKGPSKEDVKNAAGLNREDRTAMIEGMVAQLDANLKEDPTNFAGWVRLVRSYAILKKPAEAALALKNAKQQFKTDPEKLAKLNELASKMNLTEESTNGVNN